MSQKTIETKKQSPVDQKNPLEPLLFLEGDWHGNGQGPYGPYEFNMHVESRGRWMLLTSTVFEPKTDKVSYVSTQVYGYDDKGLVLQLFDTAGAFEFRGTAEDNGLRFEWEGGEDWKRSEYWPEDGGKDQLQIPRMGAGDPRGRGKV